MLEGFNVWNTVRFTVFKPPTVYTWIGFWVVSVEPSPKFHNHDNPPSPTGVEESVNCTAAPGITGVVVFAEKLATICGYADTLIQVFCVDMLNPPTPPAPRDIEKFPVVKVADGFCAVDQFTYVLELVPYPCIDQFQYVGLFVDVSVKDTDNGEIPVVTPTGVNEATGAGNWLTFTHAI